MLAVFMHNLPLLFVGIGHTLILMACSAIIGLMLAMLLTLCLYSPFSVLKKCICVYLFILRGTPFLLQLFMIYYGTIQFPWILHSPIGYLFKSAMVCAVIALSLNTSAYMTTLFSGAVDSIPHKEIVAGKMLGLSQFKIFKSIILPQVFMKILPIYSNELVMLLKCTAIASSITIVDVMGVTQQLISNTYQTIPYLLMAAIIYCLLALIAIVPCHYFYKSYCLKIDVIKT